MIEASAYGNDSTFRIDAVRPKQQQTTSKKWSQFFFLNSGVELINNMRSNCVIGPSHEGAAANTSVYLYYCYSYLQKDPDN